MDGTGKPKRYDLEDRTLALAKRVRTFIRRLPQTVSNIEDMRQLVKASGSVGANYIEANESLSKKDFRMRVKISRKESSESRFFLRLVYTADNQGLDDERDALVQEATELCKIFGSILERTT